MPEPLDYRIYSDGEWLDDSEKNFTADFDSAACFTSLELANDIAERECKNRTFYVLAVMPSL